MSSRTVLWRWGLCTRLFALTALLLLLAHCIPTPPSMHLTQAPSTAMFPGKLAVLLVAGDASAPVFRNAVLYLRDRLRALGVAGTRMRILTDQSNTPPESLATAANISISARSLQPAKGGSCLVFLTSHGVDGEGLYLGAKDEVLHPEELDESVAASCGEVPTVIIVSSCFSGRFASQPMERANRIIITASAADRSSFGCSDSDILTFFDDCLLGATGSAKTWKDVFDHTKNCVDLREERTDTEASKPQIWLGSHVEDLETPFAQAPASPFQIAFTPGQQAYSPKHVPLTAEDRAYNMPVLKRYSRAASPKALAYAPFGFVTYVSADMDGRITAEEAARLALQRCEWLTGGACILYARDNSTIAPLPSGLPPYHPPMLQRDGVVRTNTTPFIKNEQRGGIDAYLALRSPKALAINPENGRFTTAHAESMERARQVALDLCREGNDDCVIYAENDQVVLGW